MSLEQEESFQIVVVRHALDVVKIDIRAYKCWCPWMRCCRIVPCDLQSRQKCRRSLKAFGATFDQYIDELNEAFLQSVLQGDMPLLVFKVQAHAVVDQELQAAQIACFESRKGLATVKL
jgi:hypothetical protein